MQDLSAVRPRATDDLLRADIDGYMDTVRGGQPYRPTWSRIDTGEAVPRRLMCWDLFGFLNCFLRHSAVRYYTLHYDE